MKLEAFSGPEIYVDTSLFLFVALADPTYGPSSSEFLSRAFDGQFSLVTCSLALDEFLFSALIERLQQEKSVSRRRAQFLRDHPNVVAALARSTVPLMEGVMKSARVEPVLAEDAVEMGRLVAAHGLLPRDAIHVAVMKRAGLTAIATDDTDFTRVPGLEVYMP